MSNIFSIKKKILILKLKRMLSSLIIHKPDEPIHFLSEFLKKDTNCNKFTDLKLFNYKN